MLTLKNCIRFSVATCALAFAPAAASAQTADYAMHEWGLVSFLTPQVEYLTSGHEARVLPPQGVRPGLIMSDKPVIYLTPGPTFVPTTTVSATIEIPDGYLHEIYPLAPGATHPGSVTGTVYNWNEITFQPMGCGPEFAPGVRSPACMALGAGAICEAAELALYLRPVAACLRVDGVSAPVLLWNAVNNDWPTPLQTDAEPMPTVTNVTGDPVSGVFVRVGGVVQYLGDLAPGASASADEVATTIDDQTQLTDAVRVELLARGLSPNEAEDFIDAWRPDQLAFPPPWTTFGFFDADTIEARAPLTLSPEPTDRVRVLAFSAD